MTLIKSNILPRREWGMPTLLDEFFTDSFFVSSIQSTNQEWSPSIDVVESDTDYQVTAELPGLDEADIHLEFHNGSLTISGEKKEESESNKNNVYHLERRFGSFSRSLAIGDGIDEKDVEATFKKGILKVTLPKSDKVKPKTIKIAI